MMAEEQSPFLTGDAEQGSPPGNAGVRVLSWLCRVPLFLCVAAFALAASYAPSTNLSTFFLARQDRWLLLAASFLLLICGERLGSRKSKLVLPPRLLWALVPALVLFCYTGHYWVLSGYNLSRDEQMAIFDARILATGALARPLPAMWQPHAGALNTLFMLPIGNPVAWVSAYLPMNAALHALVGLIADPALTGPLMTALAAVALWKCVGLLWPEQQEPKAVAMLLFIMSGQALIAGMTSYAMPAHLALNLVWLWLFLLDKRKTDAAALLVGFVAAGLHQLPFHPFFVAPFLFLLLRRRAWPRLAFYCAGYFIICAFWILWPSWTRDLMMGPHSVMAARGTDFWSRLVLTLQLTKGLRFMNMGANVLRFFAWQSLLLVPLLIAGFRVVRRDAFAAALAASFLLPIGAMLVILPYQGHGFGYRYLHGAIGSTILLAVYGWQEMSKARDRLRSLMMRASCAAVAIILPMQLIMAHSFYAPFASRSRQISATSSDYFLVGEEDAPFAGDLVLNEPDLSNRPIRLIAAELDDSLIAGVCGAHSRVALPTDEFFAPINTYFKAPATGLADRRIGNLAPKLTAAGCSIRMVGGQ